MASIITCMLHRFSLSLKFWLLIILTSSIFSSHKLPTVVAYPLFPWAVKFHLNFQNRFSNQAAVLELNCTKLQLVGRPQRAALAPQFIPQNTDWGFEFRSGAYLIGYECEYHRRGCGLGGKFEAWKEDRDFIDDECGGRHCTWMAKDDGFYLFNIQDGKYHKKFYL